MSWCNEWQRHGRLQQQEASLEQQRRDVLLPERAKAVVVAPGEGDDREAALRAVHPQHAYAV